MTNHILFGNKGELIAANYLKEKGYTILETNWRYKNLETDIIATINNTLIIVEVKTRRSNLFGEPELFVTKKKQKNLIQAANEYIQRNSIKQEVRFDIISIIWKDNNIDIKHILDAFYAM